MRWDLHIEAQSDSYYTDTPKTKHQMYLTIGTVSISIDFLSRLPDDGVQRVNTDRHSVVSRNIFDCQAKEKFCTLFLKYKKVWVRLFVIRYLHMYFGDSNSKKAFALAAVLDNMKSP